MNKIIACVLSFAIMLVVVLGVLPSEAAIALEHQPAQVEQPMAVATLAQVQQPPKMPRATAQVQQPPKEPLRANRAIRAVSACSICFTCGGSWPIYSGTIGKLEPAASYAPTERGEACSGSLSYAEDTHPYLCCRAQ
ncbi:MAG: hypothetical protein QNJ36_07995 [Calothrix sp. MO_167.B42]|nr:hypothetical protein [Calothrix sp. MO_167.B42]